jgi:hypothetical protein
MSECSFRWAGHEFEEALPVVTLWGRRWTRAELLARVGRLEQVAGIRLVEGGDELIHLAPGETRRYRMEIGGLVGADAIEAFSREARAMVPA